MQLTKIRSAWRIHDFQIYSDTHMDLLDKDLASQVRLDGVNHDQSVRCVILARYTRVLVDFFRKLTRDLEYIARVLIGALVILVADISSNSARNLDNPNIVRDSEFDMLNMSF